MNYISRKTLAIINLPALISNYHCLANLAPQSETIAVIKANAYGHGAITVAKHLDNMVPALAVAFIDEALVLREAGITSPILILEGPLSEQDFVIASKHNFWLMLHNGAQIDWLIKQTPIYSGKLWLKVDTGMNRLGLMPSQVSNILATLPSQQLKKLVLCTHFSNAEELDNPKTLLQIKRLTQVNQIHGCKKSLANSAGIINWRESHGDYNRLGIALYGATPLLAKKLPIKLIPVMTLQSTVISIRKLNIGESVGYGETWQAKRPSIIATIAIGYADGYPRSAKVGTPVWFKSQLAPLVGRVSMDMITVDITDIDKVELGDLVELWGESLAIETVAEYSNTINYELLTRVSARVPKKYTL
ncbi:MAG: alanine racemase [Colwellia sp.]|nr:alanine racemase [Colwellia sp.]